MYHHYSLTDLEGAAGIAGTLALFASLGEAAGAVGDVGGVIELAEHVEQLRVMPAEGTVTETVPGLQVITPETLLVPHPV